MSTYTLNDLIGKRIVAKVRIPLYRSPWDRQEGRQPYAYVNAGQPIGNLFSWIDRTNSGFSTLDGLFFMFKDSANRSFYVYTFPGAFDEKSLNSQGVESVEDQNKMWYEKIIDNVAPWVIGGVVAVAVVKGLFGRK